MIMRSMEADPANRYTTALEFGQAMLGALEEREAQKLKKYLL